LRDVHLVHGLSLGCLNEPTVSRAPLGCQEEFFTETDFRPDLRTISVPTVIIHGDHDQSTPLEFTGPRTANLISGSRLVMYENAAHALPITHLRQLNKDLLALASA
jgi:non-heme chloroperoxidase